jgi:hypothetical protein
MPRLLKYGLIASGSGIALLFVAVAGGMGPCGPSSIVGILAALAGLCLVPAGVLLSIAAGVVALVRRKPKPIG